MATPLLPSPRPDHPDGSAPSSGTATAPPPRPWPAGLAPVLLLAAAAVVIGRSIDAVSPLVVGVLAGGIWANTIGVADRHRAGARLAARVLLRAGIVLLGLRLSLGDLGALGAEGIAVVASTVIATFFGTQWLGRRLGLSRDLSLLVATGYSICGASAIAAMEPNTDAEEDEVAAAIGLVTLFGTLAIIALPALAGVLGLVGEDFGSWVGASTHDVAQVIAAASTGGSVALSAAIVVKLTRVILLAPLVAGVSLHRRLTTSTTADGSRPPLLPLFVVGFLGAVMVRSSGVLSSGVIEGARLLETALLTAAMVGLGTGVRLRALRALGARPVVLGLAAWVVVAGVSLAGVTIVA